jgi:hypothetical protein
VGSEEFADPRAPKRPARVTGAVCPSKRKRIRKPYLNGHNYAAILVLIGYDQGP